MNVNDELKYSYSSKPRAVQTNRSKAQRLDSAPTPSLPSKPPPPNIMHDPRIARGSVFAPQALISPRNSNQEKPKPRRTKSSVSKPKESLYNSHRGTAYAYSELSLEENLVEQTTPVAGHDGFSQTDEFVRYVTPKKKIATADGKFHRPKVGVDSGTQIEEKDQLFNFDVEVKPLLNVLVSKTLAQALAEVKEELEMTNIIHEHKMLQGNKAELARIDRELEDKAKQAFREKEQKKKDQEIKQHRIKVMKEKVLAWQLAHSTIVPDAMKKAIAILEDKGVFYNPLHRELSRWLASEIYHGSDAKLRLREVASSLLEDLLHYALHRQSILSKLLPNTEEALVRITLRDPLFVTIDRQNEDGSTEPVTQEIGVLGPVELSRHDTLEQIEGKLHRWIASNFGAIVAIPVGGYLSLLKVAESL